MEQSGFRADQEQFYQGAKTGWEKLFANLEEMLARVESAGGRSMTTAGVSVVPDAG